MFTQRDEEPYILKTFGDTIGRFLDIGAYDGKCFSTTHALALRGWGGVCVEPSPSVLPALCALYKNNEKIKVLPVAIADTTGKVLFYDSNGDMISSIDSAHAKKWADGCGVNYTELQIDSLSVADLFAKVGHDFEFISLDVEGINFDVFSKFPFAQLTKTKLMCIEFDYKEAEILAMVEPFGFTELHKTAENLILVRS